MTPEAVVTVARLKSSPLHDLVFNVSQKQAAERYYLHRAGVLIASIRVVNEQGEITHLRANVRLVTKGDDDEESSTYLSIDEEAARRQREAWLRGRLLSIKTELRELNLYPQVALAIEETLAA